MSSIKKVYDFELSSSVYPVMMEVDLSGSTGFYVADESGTAATKNSLGYYDITDESTKYCLYINETVSPGTYTFPVVLVQVSGPENEQTIWRSDGDTSKGHNVPSFGNVDGQLDSESNQIGPFIILEDSFSLVDNLVGDLHVSFDSIESCAGGCDSENKFITYDEDGFSYLNNVFTLTRQTEKACDCSEITWSYTGFTYPVPEGEPEPAVLSEFISGTGYGVREPVVYERDYGNGPTGDPSYDCECDDASSAGYAYVTVTLNKNNCCMNEAGDGVEKVGEGCKDEDGNDLPAHELWDTLKVAYGTSNGGSGIFYQEWCSDDMYNELNGIAFPNDRQSCDVSSNTDKIIAKNGQVYIEFQECGEVGGYYNNTPTPKASCTATHTITPTSSSTHTPTSTHSATPSDSHTPTATVPPTGTSGILIGITPCSYNGDGEVPIQAYLFDVDGGATVPSTSIKLGGECFTTEFIYPISARVQNAPVIEIQEDGTPKYTEQGNYGAVKRRARNNQPIFQAHQNIWDNLTSMHVHADWAEIDADFAFFDDCPACESTPTETASASVTPSATDTPTPSATDTPTSSATDTPTQTISATPSATESATTTPTESATGSASVTLTASATQTSTPTSTGTPTESATVTQTPSPTATEVYDTATHSAVDCNYDITFKLDWTAGDPYPDLDLYVKYDKASDAIYYGQSNLSDTASAPCGPWELQFADDIYAGCDETTPVPPEQISGTMQRDGDFKVWYNQHSDCAAAPAWVSGSIVIDNKGQDDIEINGTGINAGNSLTINGLVWAYGGYNAGDQPSYTGGTLYQISGCNCSTTTASATVSSTESATPTSTDSAVSATATATSTALCPPCLKGITFPASGSVPTFLAGTWEEYGTFGGKPYWKKYIGGSGSIYNDAYIYWNSGTSAWECSYALYNDTSTGYALWGQLYASGGGLETGDCPLTGSGTADFDTASSFGYYWSIQVVDCATTTGSVTPSSTSSATPTVSATHSPTATGSATPTATDATGDEGGGSGCCGCSTAIYAMQTCGSSSTIFVMGQIDSSQENSYSSSSPYIIIGSTDESILCEPFCARFVSHTANGTAYGPGEDMSADYSGDPGATILADSVVEGVTNGGSATAYADCTACQNDCDNC